MSPNDTPDPFDDDEPPLWLGRMRKPRRGDLLALDGWHCRYCNVRLTLTEGPQQAHVEHQQSKSKGGRNHRANVVLACRTCNLNKSGRNLVEWIAWRIETRQPVYRPMLSALVESAELYGVTIANPYARIPRSGGPAPVGLAVDQWVKEHA